MRKSASRRAQILVVMIGALSVASGCAKKEQPQPPKQRQVNKPVSPVQPQATTAKVVETGNTLLDFTNKRDPFRPFTVENAPKEQPRSGGVARSGEILPIQSYDVNRFRVAGIITGLKENSALIIDPAGRGYVVHEGMMVGTNDGRIRRITPSAIEVVEQYRDDNGHLRKRSVILSLAKKK
jgi:type IV pilus assembly protein PilP